MKKILIGVLIAAALGSAAFFLFKGNKDELNFKTEKVAKGDIVSSITASGAVNAVTTVLVGPQVSAPIKNIYVDFNSVVKQGQLRAQIDPAIFEAQVEQAKANLLSTKANVEKANVE